jgi:hypothetical protein
LFALVSGRYATNNKTTAHNPFLTGENPAEFVCNCLRCGQIIWYNEPTEKKCHSGRTKDCYNLWVDACDPETGDIDVDYALTKKARKKNRRAREDRERRNNTGGVQVGVPTYIWSCRLRWNNPPLKI